MLETNN